MIKNFDVIKFLGLEGIDKKAREELRPRLEKNLVDYLLIHLFDQMKEEDAQKLNKVTNLLELLELLQKAFPQLKEKSRLILADFRKEYQKEYAGS